MLAQIFKAVLITSLAGSFLAVVITLLKPVTKKVFGYLWHYYIWLAVLFVMIAPVRFSLPQRGADIPAANTQAVQTEHITETANAVNDSHNVNTANTITAAQKATDFIGKILDNRMNYLGIIWLLGTAMMLMTSIIGYIRLIMKIRRNSVIISCPEASNYTDKKITVRSGKDLSSPFMLGIFRPTLVLPDRELNAEQLNNILCHEMTHFRRKDILYKWFTLLVRSVHWFNPVVYYIARQINNECEISCDLSVVSQLNGDGQISYVNTILSLASSDRAKRVPLTTQMASGKKALKRRFTMIKNVKKTSKFMSVLSAITAVLMLGTTVFASGVLSDLATDDYTIEITNKGEKIELSNKPFVENGEVYVPLRETIEKSDKNAVVTWDNGAISIDIAGNKYLMSIGNYSISVNPAKKDEATFAINAQKYPILKDSTTYVPFNTLVYLFTYGQNNNYSFVYKIYDKNGNVIYLDSFYHQVLGEYSIKIPVSWSGKYIPNASDNIISFFHKATYEKYGVGTLFSIEKVSATTAEEILDMLGGSRLLYKNDEYAYIFVIPTDVQYPIWTDSDEEDIAIAAEYEEMSADIDFIANSFAIALTSEPKPEMPQQGSEFLGGIISDCLKSCNYADEYSYSVKSYEHSDENNSLKLYVEILPKGMDSYDYLTITLVKTGENDWSVDDFFLEK